MTPRRATCAARWDAAARRATAPPPTPTTSPRRIRTNEDPAHHHRRRLPRGAGGGGPRAPHGPTPGWWSLLRTDHQDRPQVPHDRVQPRRVGRRPGDAVLHRHPPRTPSGRLPELPLVVRDPREPGGRRPVGARPKGLERPPTPVRLGITPDP